MKAMSNQLRSKIQKYIKNGIDISELIKDVNLRGANLSRAKIKDISRHHEDMSRVDFSKAIIGREDKTTRIIDCNLVESNFNEAIFVGSIIFRRNNCQRSNFNGAFLPHLQYQKTDFRFATFCEAVIRIGSTYGEGSRFSADLFKDLGRMWGLEISVKDEVDEKTV